MSWKALRNRSLAGRRSKDVPAWQRTRRAVAASGPEHTVDTLELREAIIGHGVLLNEPDDGGFVLHLVAAGHTAPLGRFADAADAWRAVDALDDPLAEAPADRATPGRGDRAGAGR